MRRIPFPQSISWGGIALGIALTTAACGGNADDTSGDAARTPFAEHSAAIDTSELADGTDATSDEIPDMPSADITVESDAGASSSTRTPGRARAEHADHDEPADDTADHAVDTGVEERGDDEITTTADTAGDAPVEEPAVSEEAPTEADTSTEPDAEATEDDGERAESEASDDGSTDSSADGGDETPGDSGDTGGRGTVFDSELTRLERMQQQRALRCYGQIVDRLDQVEGAFYVTDEMLEQWQAEADGILEHLDHGDYPAAARQMCELYDDIVSSTSL